jgi:hypothetical protein
VEKGEKLMPIQVNQEAVEKAKQLIDEGKFRINTPWRDVQPSPIALNRYLSQHGENAYSQWFLAIDPDAAEAERYTLPFGDFNSVHRSGVMAAKQRAEQHHAPDVEAAADELLDLFDRLNAC